ncbi:MAG: LacI family DNA-binding transcriptional regulator [Verrucomicrobia bacterium]|nr:LacI family DNA-binding transcriptional regulator [Verrucomicrobiota bacterium]
MISRVSIYDIAQRMGVSHTTVSNVLNRHGHERKVSRARSLQIRRFAEKMGYSPNHAARSLKLGRTNTILLSAFEALHHPHIHEMIEELQAALMPHGYQMMLNLMRNATDLTGVLRAFSCGWSDGAILLTNSTLFLEEMLQDRRREMPLVLVGPAHHLKVSCVSYNRAKAAELAVTHLLQQGHRRVAMVLDARDDLPGRKRVEGYRSAMEKEGLLADERLFIRSPVDADMRALWAGIERLKPRPTAVFCYNDELALGLLQAVHRAGLRVPEDVALVTMANSRLTTVADVPLTAVDTNNRGIAKTAVEMLLAQVRDSKAPVRQVLVEPFLVERASSGERKRP